jgi:cyclopropane fatty-acyl-phospholipid synthase-like methyltransferase
MTTHEKTTFFATYDWAKSWQDLPWAHNEPTLFLAEICRQRKPGRALDIGCGAGTDSVFLASQGWDVTSLDFMPKALQYTQQRAREAGVSVTAVEADIAEWQPTGTYNLVLDHGLLHNMDPERYPAYRATVLRALANNGDFVLLHWNPRYPGQANGKMGPTRVDREAIKTFFAPELQERFFAREEFEDLPDMVGGGMTQAYYWFRFNQAHQRPADLLGQIHGTLKRHAVDAEAMLRAAGDGPVDAALPAGLLAKLVGPGRLGLTHRVPEPAEAGGILAAWAAHAGVAARQVENLLTIFASDQLGKVCVAGSPRCDQCAVSFCKRLRYR